MLVHQRVASTPRFGGVFMLFFIPWSKNSSRIPGTEHRFEKMDPKRRAKDIKGAPHDVPGVFSTLNGKNLKPNKWAIKITLVDWLIYNYIYIL